MRIPADTVRKTRPAFEVYAPRRWQCSELWRALAVVFFMKKWAERDYHYARTQGREERA